MGRIRNVERKKKVLELAKAGITPKKISETLGIPLRTIYKDLAEYRRYLAEQLKNYNWQADIMTLWQRNNMIALQLQNLLKEAKTPMQKRAILRTLAEVTEWQFKSLQYLGILEREPTINYITHNEINYNLTEELNELIEAYKKWKKKKLEY